ncbi:preprotein translocase subunit SecG [Rubripirellula reticaptiva]|uniref:Protein-export membrane protein SecG n=1 Tax=Rubripirellula reticaptiva TaxID=2528013 RepID=A0A5C6F8Q2_9BACT|nr:preprotein translocase subunit SecG [Rubripirellula reticaptiva]TWU57695.1 preprotein translocase subunit SecG [Rubripirellula reticaptiva]
MTFLLIGSVSSTLLGFLMGFLSLFLILLILIQRGKGGGLTGALGGPGGQSAFGSKAGDTFTVITVVVAAVWGFTCAFTMWLLGTHAPSPIADSTLSAGPGDQATQTGNELVIPPMGGFDGASLSGPDADAELTETPEPAMVPVEKTTPADEPVAEDAAPEETTAEETTAE